MSPICLPATNKDYAGMKGKVTGWGIDIEGYNANTHTENVSQPEMLLDGNVIITSNSDCQLQAKIHKDTLHPEELCTLEHGTTCQGDSGGPLFIEEHDNRCN